VGCMRSSTAATAGQQQQLHLITQLRLAPLTDIISRVIGLAAFTSSMHGTCVRAAGSTGSRASAAAMAGLHCGVRLHSLPCTTNHGYLSCVMPF
jgi:hypothetical protein